MMKYNERGYRIPKEHLACRFGSHYSDSVPMPFGSGNCSMPGFECTYEGEIEIPDEIICDETSKCPAYQPEPTMICPKHDIEYTEFCELCCPESEDW